MKVEYERRALGKKLGGFMSGGDLMLYAITGSDILNSYFRAETNSKT